MKHFKSIILCALACLALGLTSCDDYLDVNRNTDAPDYVEGYLYLAGIQQAYQGIYWDLRAVAPLTQMMGTSSYSNFANHYYTKGSDAGGEAWRMVYWNQGMNLENMINQSVEAENWTLAGIGLAMKAFSWDLLTKVNGEAPMKQAYEAGRLSHEYDYQYDIYPQVREWAYQAIEYLQKEDNSSYGNRITNNDFIYGGDKDKWIKFAYAVIARNLVSLTNKKDFKEKYYNEFLTAVNNAFASNDDNATLKIWGGSADAAESGYNNFWGTYRGNLVYSYFQHDYPVQLFTGTIRKYDEEGNFIRVEVDSADLLKTQHYPYALLDKQITSDTLPDAGHFDPRRLVKLATTDSNNYATITDREVLRKLYYAGSGFTGAGGPIATAPSFWGRNATSNTTYDGAGRWLYRDDAPYIMTTYTELLFDLAEVQYKYGSKSDAFETWKKAMRADMEFTASYIVPGTTDGTYHQGDKVSKATFNSLAAEYLTGPYVGGLPIGDFSLSHIMMQKYLALYPWGAIEAWVDMRKYFYDIQYTGEYPKYGNGWDKTTLDQKRDEDPTKVYKGFYLLPAQFEGRRGTYNADNNGSPCFRIRPRYNSEYMWNKTNLDALLPIGGQELDYQCSIMWFCYPGDMPTER